MPRIRRPSPISTSTAAATTRAGTSYGERWYERQIELGVIDPSTTSRPATPGSRRGTTSPRTSQLVLPSPTGGVRSVPRSHRRPDRPRCRWPPGDGRARQHDPGGVVRQRRLPGGRARLGVMHEMKFFNGILEIAATRPSSASTTSVGPHSHTNYPWGWAQCGNSPFRWYKHAHPRGRRARAAGRALARRPRRRQGRDEAERSSPTCPTSRRPSTTCSASHAPETYRGVDQMPVTGHSFASVLERSRRRRRPTPCSTSSSPARRALVAERRRRAGGRRSPGTSPATDLRRPTPGSSTTSRPIRPSATTWPRSDPGRLAELIDLWWSGGGTPRRAARSTTRHRLLFIPRIGDPSDQSPHGLDRTLHLPAADDADPDQQRPASLTDNARSTSPLASARVDGRRPGACSSATGNETCGCLVLRAETGASSSDYNAFGDHTIVQSNIEVPSW